MPQQLPRLNGQAIAALVLGVVGLVLALIPFVGVVLGLLGVVFGIVGLRGIKASQEGAGELRRGSGLAIAGIVTGTIALLLGGLILMVFVLGSRVSNTFERTNACISDPTSTQCP